MTLPHTYKNQKDHLLYSYVYIVSEFTCSLHLGVVVTLQCGGVLDLHVVGPVR